MLEKGNRANTLHGILLIALFSFAAFYIAGFPIVKRLSFSPLIVGIVLGMLYANSLRNKLPETWVPGINCLLYTSPSPRDVEESGMPSSA